MDAVPGQACQLGHGGEAHLPGHGQNQRLKQQGETGELGEPIGLDQDNLHVRQREARCSDFQEAFVLEEIKMLRALDLGVVHGIKGADARDGKPGSGNEVEADRQHLPACVEINALDVPRFGNTQGRFKELVLSVSVPRRASSRAQHGKAAAPLAIRAAGGISTGEQILPPRLSKGQAPVALQEAGPAIWLRSTPRHEIR